MELPSALSAPDIRLGVVELITINEAAALMGVSKMTVYRLVHANVLPAMRVDRSYRIQRTDLAAFLRTGTMPRPTRKSLNR
ncbi:MAG TPA: helix-turn-helix domain-containing protein [Pseudonocardia sp.]